MFGAYDANKHIMRLYHDIRDNHVSMIIVSKYKGNIYNLAIN
jgi:hypothetical protein